MSGKDAMKKWALQVAATNDREEWCEQVNRQELELRVAIVLAGIYATELRKADNCGPRFPTNYDIDKAGEEEGTIVICGACHTPCTKLDKGEECTEHTNICKDKNRVYVCTQQGCNSGERHACKDCVRHTSKREKVYITAIEDVDETTQAHVREVTRQETEERD